MTEGNFVDYVKLFVRSGNGGKGSTHLHREKYIDKGGPDGGDGGRGGHVIIRANQQMWTLYQFKFKKHFKAGHGGDGGRNNRSGKKGQNIIDQIKAQVRKLIPVHNLIDITELKSFIGKELILMKLDIKQNTVLKIHKHIKNIGAKILFEDKTVIIIEFSGTPTEISSLIKKMKVYNIVELTRSGLVSMALGKDYIRR